MDENFVLRIIMGFVFLLLSCLFGFIAKKAKNTPETGYNTAPIFYSASFGLGGVVFFVQAIANYLNY